MYAVQASLTITEIKFRSMKFSTTQLGGSRQDRFDFKGFRLSVSEDPVCMGIALQCFETHPR